MSKFFFFSLMLHINCLSPLLSLVSSSPPTITHTGGSGSRPREPATAISASPVSVFSSFAYFEVTVLRCEEVNSFFFFFFFLPNLQFWRQSSFDGMSVLTPTKDIITKHVSTIFVLSPITFMFGSHGYAEEPIFFFFFLKSRHGFFHFPPYEINSTYP
jgi:hypothetical protein